MNESRESHELKTGSGVAPTREILVVDDDDVTRNLLKEVFQRDGVQVELARSGEEAIARIRARGKKSFGVVVSDIRMLEADGLAVLREAKKADAGTPVVLMTGFGSMEGAVLAIQQGAFDYISKPFQMQDLKILVERAFKQRANRDTAGGSSKVAASELKTPKAVIGRSAKIVEVYKALARAAMSPSNVLIIGESGTGKELIARGIHGNSQRKTHTFVAVNCGALTETLLESELFGHVKGSFTGAVSDKKGLLEEANQGTLFLDEIGDLSSGLQVKLLRVLQEGEFRPVGGHENRKVDIRFVAATHRRLDQLVAQGKFREDLFYRLKVIAIDVPPLRERLEDLDELVDYFLARYAGLNKKMISHVSREAMVLLRAYPWPGNIRELEHAIERAVAFTASDQIFPEDLPPEIRSPGVSSGAASGAASGVSGGTPPAVSQVVSQPAAVASDQSLEDLEKLHIIRVLEETGFNKSQASEILGIDRATLYRKAQKYGIELKKSR